MRPHGLRVYLAVSYDFLFLTLQFVLAVKSQERQKHRSGAGIMATIGGAFMGVAFAAANDTE